MKNVEISVVIPIYNVERYVAKTIESVQHQDFAPYEIILVDDGASDGSGIICDQYAAIDGRIKVIHKVNGGVMSARFAGVDAAQGKYIAFLDGDDRMPSNALSIFYKAMVDNNVDYVAGLCVDVDIEGNRINNRFYGPNFQGILSGNKQYRSFISRNPKGMNMKLYKRELLVENPRIVVPSFIRNNEDFIFNLFLASKISKVASIDDIVAYVVERPGSASRVVYTADYWLNLFSWMDENYEKYDVFVDDYLQYKLFIIFEKLIKPCLIFDLRNNCFDNVRNYEYNIHLGVNRLITMFVIKHPFIWCPFKLLRLGYDYVKRMFFL